MNFSSKIKVIGLLIVLMAGFAIYDWYSMKSLTEANTSTIARILEVREGKGSKYIVYKFYVDGKSYDGSLDIEKYSQSSNRFYNVRYASQNPDWNELLVNQPVSDTNAIKAAGFDLPKEKINQFKEK